MIRYTRSFSVKRSYTQHVRYSPTIKKPKPKALFKYKRINLKKDWIHSNKRGISAIAWRESIAFFDDILKGIKQIRIIKPNE